MVADSLDYKVIVYCMPRVRVAAEVVAGRRQRGRVVVVHSQYLVAGMEVGQSVNYL